LSEKGRSRRGNGPVRQELFSGLVRLHVLYHACEEPIFGLGMIEELARHGYRLSPGTMYPLLRGLERKGLLRSERKLVHGKIRCLYHATPAGRRALNVAKERVGELFGELFEDETIAAVVARRADRHRDGEARVRGTAVSD
jgi:PadR family transcriptional regulator PadR